jgi:hypothetical protein
MTSKAAVDAKMARISQIHFSSYLSITSIVRMRENDSTVLMNMILPTMLKAAIIEHRSANHSCFES